MLTGGIKSHTHTHTITFTQVLLSLGLLGFATQFGDGGISAWKQSRAATVRLSRTMSPSRARLCSQRNRPRLTHSLLFAKHCAGHEACSCDHERRVTLLHVPRQGATVDERHSRQTPLEQLSRPTSTTAHFACKSNYGMAQVPGILELSVVHVGADLVLSCASVTALSF